MENDFNFKKYLAEGALLKESDLTELDANVEKLRDAYLAKLTAISKAEQDLFNDPLFDVDLGARDLTKKYFMDKEKINNSWKALYNYVRGTTPPQLAGKPGAPTPPGTKPPLGPPPINRQFGK
jgi:hypothetical protein